MKAKLSLEQGSESAAERYFRQSIKVQPNAWDAYKELGALMVVQGRSKDAAALFLQFPDFKEGSNANAVGISNEAYEAGNELYRVGEFAAAKRLYEIAS